MNGEINKMLKQQRVGEENNLLWVKIVSYYGFYLGKEVQNILAGDKITLEEIEGMEDDFPGGREVPAGREQS